jgi:plastocyanin
MLKRLFPAAFSIAAIAAAVASEGRPHRLPVDIAELGSVSGKLTFSAARPKQPVVVYLEGVPAGAKPAPLVVRQRGAQFNPAFAVVVAGQEVVFDNDEDQDIDHNVYTLGAEEINLDIFSRGTKRSHTFSATGEVSVYCSVHKLMDGKLFVAPSPAFSIAGEDGSFRIPQVPAGTYVLRTYQKAKRFKDAEVKVDVRAGQDSAVGVEMKR